MIALCQQGSDWGGQGKEGCVSTTLKSTEILLKAQKSSTPAVGTEVKEVPNTFFGGSGVKKACGYPE